MQFTENQTALGKGIVTGLCMECAMRHHDYRQMLQHETDNDHISDTPFPQTWIDGRRHMLLSRAWTHQEMCPECNRGAESLRAHEIKWAVFLSAPLDLIKRNLGIR